MVWAAFALVLALLLAALYFLMPRLMDASKLNLELSMPLSTPPAVGDAVTFFIHPTNAAGLGAPVNGIVWTGASASADGLSATLTLVAGDNVVKVDAASLAGVALTDTKTITVTVVDNEATALNLTAA